LGNEVELQKGISTMRIVAKKGLAATGIAAKGVAEKREL
jgi:hypothetical protein